MHGGTLKSKILNQMVKRPQIVYTNVQALRWCLNIAEGVANMHSSVPMVIHRDLKTDNVLLTNHSNDAVAKIADLGLHAMVNPTGAEDFNHVDDTAPSSGTPSENGGNDVPGKPFKLAKSYKQASKEVGSPLRSGQAAAEDVTLWKMTGKTGAFCYMAPEVLLGEPYNEKVDVFSIGVIIYEVFSKRLVGADYLNAVGWDESEAHAHKVAQGFRPPHPQFMPEEIRQLVDLCWSGKPTQRPSMSEVVKRLRAIQEMGIVEEMDAAQAKSVGCGCTLM
jgi:serine/threonine protein kinase